jgi:peptide chain release factor 1
MKLRSKLEKIEHRARDIEQEVSAPETMKDQMRYQKLTRELAGIRPVVEKFIVYKKTDSEISGLEHSLEDKTLDVEMRQLMEQELEELRKTRAKLEEDIEDLLFQEADPNQTRDTIIEVRAGTGGEEAALFCADLFRMFSRYATAKKLSVEVMDSNPTGKGGFKEIVFAINGPGAYGFFKYEMGIHRVQRVPATEANGRIHTSAVTVAVLPEADETEVTINPADLKIDVYRASGAGGQHVNKTESAVRITHMPTGVVVQCQDERSQHKNKEKAMRVLRARLYDAAQQKHHEEMAKQRRDQIGSGDRSGKIRTYNYPDQRVTDHRIGLTLHALNDILDGHLDDLVQALRQHEREQKLNDAA